MAGILLQQPIERLARFPVLVPARLVAEHAELQPDVVEGELADEKEDLLVFGPRHQLRLDDTTAAFGRALETAEQLGARRASFEGLLLAGGFAELTAHEQEQGAGPDLARRRLILLARRRHQLRRRVVARTEESCCPSSSSVSWVPGAGAAA